MAHSKLVKLTFFSTFFLTTFAHSAEREHDAHEHGIAELNVVMEQNAVVIQLISPAVNIVGFEHAPNTTEQEQLVEKALATLEDGGTLFKFPAAAGCRLEHAEVHSGIGGDHEDEHGDEDHEENHDEHEEEHDDHKEEHDEEHESSHSDEDEAGTHSEFEAEYEFACEDIAQIDQISTSLFELFPLTEEITVQLISPDAQTATTLRPEAAAISL